MSPSRAYNLPVELRAQLAQPLGQVFGPEDTRGKEFEKLAKESPMVVTVGDRVTETLAALRTPEVQVVDGVERRQKRDLPEVPFARLIRVENPAGTVTSSAIDGMKKAFTGMKPVRVQVDGEEDLMAMLAIALAPISAMVFYGQPGVGVVAVKANAISKSRNRALLSKMGIKALH